MQENLALYEELRQELIQAHNHATSKIGSLMRDRLSAQSAEDRKAIKRKMLDETEKAEKLLAPLHAELDRLKKYIEDDVILQHMERVARASATLSAAYMKSLVPFNVAQAMTDGAGSIVESQPLKLIEQ
jgi:hypothetical protein